MSVEQADVIDGIGLEAAGETVVMLISDDLAWDDPTHIRKLAAKVDAYASVVMSGEIVVSYPQSTGQSPVIRVVHEYLPDDAALAFLKSAASQLQFAGIGFEHIALPKDR